MSREVNWVILHCSASDNVKQDSIEAIKRLHTANPAVPFKWGGYETYGRGWNDVGYHHFINRAGEVFKGRHEDKVGAHAKGHNSDSIGICLSGNSNFTEAQFEALRVLLKDIFKRHNLTKQDVLGHCDVSGKTCPNFDVKKFLETLVLED